MKKIYLFSLLILTLITYNNFAEPLQLQKYHFINVPFDNNIDFSQLLEFHPDLEGAIFKNNSIKFFANDYFINCLMINKVKFDYLIKDIESFYASRLKNQSDISELIPDLTNFKFGSMGGYYTFEEIEHQLSDMEDQFPGSICKKMEIGRTIEGRPIKAYCFGNCSDTTKPEILFTALHHAREPEGLMALIYFLWDILQKAQIQGSEAQYLINNRRLWVIPCINPDGYAYNESNYPTGGGMWRKNRHKTSDTSFGVDINRNYGPMEFWNSLNNGSSINKSDDNYRGDAPFSEKETQAVRDFCLGYHFKITLNYHTYANDLLYPYGALNKATPDSVLYQAMAADVTKTNSLSVGRDIETLDYSTRGCSDDWMYYSDSLKSKIISLTSEIGNLNDGFWPTTDRIIPLAKDNLRMNYELLWSCDVNIVSIDKVVEWDSQMNSIVAHILLQNVGIEDSKEKPSITLNSLNSLFKIKSPTQEINPLKSLEKQLLQFSIEKTQEDIPYGTKASFEIVISQQGVQRRDTIYFRLYEFSDNYLFTYGTPSSNWNLGTWGTQWDDSLKEYVFTDSPYDKYPDNTNNYLTWSLPLLIEYPTDLEFFTHWQIERNSDFAMVEVSSDNGLTWEFVHTNRMSAASGLKYTPQEAEAFGFSGRFPIWVRQTCSLDKYIGKKIYLRFAMKSDMGMRFDGWYLKEIKLRTYTTKKINLVQDSTISTFEIKPNPVLIDNNIIISLPNINEEIYKSNIKVYNVLGEEQNINSNLYSNSNSVELKMGNLQTGFYIIILNVNHEYYKSGLLVLP